MFLCAHVTWSRVECPMRVSKEVCRSSLKAGVRGAFIFIGELF